MAPYFSKTTFSWSLFEEINVHLVVFIPSLLAIVFAPESKLVTKVTDAITLIEILCMVNFISLCPRKISAEPLKRKCAVLFTLAHQPMTKDIQQGVGKNAETTPWRYLILSVSVVTFNLSVLLWCRHNGFLANSDHIIFSNASLVLFSIWSGIQISLDLRNFEDILSRKTPSSLWNTFALNESGGLTSTPYSDSHKPNSGPYVVPPIKCFNSTQTFPFSRFNSIKRTNRITKRTSRVQIRKRTFADTEKAIEVPLGTKTQLESFWGSPLAASTSFTTLCDRNMPKMVSSYSTPSKTSLDTMDSVKTAESSETFPTRYSKSTEMLFGKIPPPILQLKPQSEFTGPITRARRTILSTGQKKTEKDQKKPEKDQCKETQQNPILSSLSSDSVFALGVNSYSWLGSVQLVFWVFSQVIKRVASPLVWVFRMISVFSRRASKPFRVTWVIVLFVPSLVLHPKLYFAPIHKRSTTNHDLDEKKKDFAQLSPENSRILCVMDRIITYLQPS